MKRRLLRAAVAGVGLLIVARAIDAYVIDGVRWSSPQATFYVSIPGESGLWNTAFENALQSWSVAGFRFSIVRDTYSDPCDASDSRNGVRFHSSLCGTAFGSAVLATTTTYYVGSSTLETDIVFNSNEAWDVYSGAWRYSAADFRRVAVHELGHTIGLDHEDRVPSIMSSYAGDLTTPQADDIAGVRALYGMADDFGDSRGYAHAVAPNSSTSGVIGTGSDVDFFRVRLTSRGRLVLRTTGTTDTVGTLYNSTGGILASNDDGCGSIANFCLARILNAGTYFVKVDGYLTTATGPYTLVSRFAVDDYGNTRSEAHSIAPSSTTSGRINSTADVDFFRIRLTRAGRLSLRTNGTTNTLGTLYAANGTQLATNNNGCNNGVNFCIVRNLPIGKYYLKVDGYGSAVGNYSLVSVFR